MNRDLRRPRGWLRHYAGLLGPDSLAAQRVSLERGAGARVRRVAQLALERPGGRRRAPMRSLIATPGAKLRWRSVPEPPAPPPLGAVVAPLAVSTCDIDCPVLLGATQIPLPLHPGHECVAEVLSVGSQVGTVAPGDRVVVPFQINCGECAACRAGNTGNCLAVPPLAMYGLGFAGGLWGGAFADRLAVPFADAMLVALPDGIEAAAAASVADNVADAYRHVAPHLPALLDADPSVRVLVLGACSQRSLFAASLPLYTGMIALALGAREVHLCDARLEVRAHARRLGMRTLRPRELRRCEPFGLVADISAGRLAIALGATAPDGVCSSAGGLHRSARFPLVGAYVRNATLHVGRTHARALIPAVLDLMASGQLRPELVTTTLAPLEDAPRVLSEHVRDPHSIKAVFVA